MRAVVLLLLLLVAGCAQQSPGTPKPDDKVMPADFAGSVNFANGTVAPPYHYEWTVTFDASTAVVEWRPGYEEGTQPWRHSVDITDEQRAGLYQKLRDLGVFDMEQAIDDGLVGGPGGHIEVTAGGTTYDPGSLGSSEDSSRVLRKAADAAKELVPADVWAGLEAKQDEWSAQQPK